MSKLHLSFKSFRPELIALTEALFEAKPWQEGVNDEAKALFAQAWIDGACLLYQLPPLTYELVSSDESLAVGTMYEPQYGDGNDKIRATKFSIVNLFCAFAAHRGEHTRAKAGQNPTGWGYSLFYRVRPKMFRARVREGRIYGVMPRDLYTAETWERIRAAGLDPAQKNILSTLARIDAGEDTSFAATEEMSASEEEAALEALEDVIEGDDDNAEDTSVPLPFQPRLMNVRELRRHATEQGVRGAWSMNRDAIMAALETVDA